MDDPIFDPWCLGEESQPAPAQRTSRWRSAVEGGSTWFELPAPAPRPEARPEPASETASKTASETDQPTPAQPARRAASNDGGGRPIRSSAPAVAPPSPPTPPAAPVRTSAPAPTPTSAPIPTPAPIPTSAPTPAAAPTRVPPPNLELETAEPPEVWDLASLRPSETPARAPRAPRRRSLEGAVTDVQDVLVPCVDAMSGRLVTAGHQATVDNRLAERPPSYRFRVVPWRGPFDDTEAGPGGVLEIVIEGAHGDAIVGRIWLDPYSPAPTDERSIPRSDFSAEWLDKLLLDLVRGVLRHR